MAAYSGPLDAGSDRVLTAAVAGGDWQTAYEKLLDDFRVALG